MTIENRTWLAGLLGTALITGLLVCMVIVIAVLSYAELTHSIDWIIQHLPIRSN